MLSPSAMAERLVSQIPTVLVVGDFSSAGTFASSAWERICLDYTEGNDSQRLPCLEPSHALCDALKVLSRRNSRSVRDDSKLYPVPFPGMCDGAQQGIAASVLRYLCSLNVVSIIACGTAGDTRNLLNRIWPLSTPVMVVVDSTMQECASDYLCTWRYNTALRLVPSNDLQAQAMLARVAMIAEQYSRPTVQVFCPGSDAYTLDLAHVLEEHWRYAVNGIVARFVSNAQDLESSPKQGILIYIGYSTSFSKLVESGKQWRHVILSDGCSNNRALSLARVPAGGAEYFLSQPTYSHSTYARDAYIAINAVWRRISEDNANAFPEGYGLARSFQWRVGSTLERLWPNRYKFRGNENQRGGYLLERVELNDKL